MEDDTVNRGTEKGDSDKQSPNERVARKKPDMPDSNEPTVGAVGEHNSGQMSGGASDQVGTTPVMDAGSKEEPSATGPTPREEDVRDRKVDPEAVRESFKEAELDPIAEVEPEEGEKAA